MFKEKLFIDRWLKDREIRKVSKIILYPGIAEPGVYNTWPGFAADKLVAIEDDALVAELSQPIVAHLHDVITNGNAVHTEWLLDYLANIVKRPHMKTMVAIYLCGKQGAGKDIIFDYFRSSILGEKIAAQTDDPENDLIGRFATLMHRNIFVLVDEVKSLHAFGDKLKNLITHDQTRFEAKGQKTIHVDSYVNFIFTSNNEDAVSVETDDRRFVLFKCNPLRRGDTAYFDGLLDHLARPEVSRAFFQFLMARDLSKYPNGFQKTRPVTDYYIESRSSNIPIVQRFFSAMVNSDRYEKIATLTAAALFQTFREFVEKNGYEQSNPVKNTGSFGRKVNNVEGVTKDHSSHAMRKYLLNMDAIREGLIRNNQYDTESFI